MPERVITPWRNITRLSVMTKCVVRQLTNFTTNQAKAASHTTPAATPTTVAVESATVSPVDQSSPQAASAVTTRSTRPGPMSALMCGCLCTTTTSSSVSTSIGYATGPPRASSSCAASHAAGGAWAGCRPDGRERVNEQVRQ